MKKAPCGAFSLNFLELVANVSADRKRDNHADHMISYG